MENTSRKDCTRAPIALQSLFGRNYKSPEILLLRGRFLVTTWGLYLQELELFVVQGLELFVARNDLIQSVSLPIRIYCHRHEIACVFYFFFDLFLERDREATDAFIR